MARVAYMREKSQLYAQNQLVGLVSAM